MKTYDLSKSEDFEAYALVAGRRVAHAVRFGLAYGIPYKGDGSNVRNRPGAYGQISQADFAKLEAAFGSKAK